MKWQFHLTLTISFYAHNIHLYTFIYWASKAHLKQNTLTKSTLFLLSDKLSLCLCIYQQNLSTEANLDTECRKLQSEK